MEQDLRASRYASYIDLRAYMRGSAVAVARMMLCVMGSGDSHAIVGADALAQAMQLTNFLRDLAEDAERGRVYLPQDEMRRFGVDEADLFERRFSANLADLVRFQIARARGLYREAAAAVPLLPVPMRAAVATAAALYERILDRIEAQGFDPFLGRARTGKLEKLGVAFRMAWTYR